MRTTVDVPDDLYRAVKILAAENGTTVRELILEGIETVLNMQRPRASTAEERLAEGDPTGSRESSGDVIGFP